MDPSHFVRWRQLLTCPALEVCTTLHLLDNQRKRQRGTLACWWCSSTDSLHLRMCSDLKICGCSSSRCPRHNCPRRRMSFWAGGEMIPYLPSRRTCRCTGSFPLQGRLGPGRSSTNCPVPHKCSGPNILGCSNSRLLGTHRQLRNDFFWALSVTPRHSPCL